VKFGKDLYTNGKAEDYTDQQKEPNYTAQKASSAAIGHQGYIKRTLVDGLGWRHVGRSHTFILCLQVTRATCCCERITKPANSKGRRQAWGGIPAEQGVCTNE